MSIFSHLFHHHHNPPPPKPIEGRDEEFRRTIVFYYQQELGRDPGESEIVEPTGWMHALHYGMTGEQLQTLIHTSPEAIAYRARPKFHTPKNAIHGKLYAKDGVFWDASGIRRVQFYTDMPALRIWADFRQEALRTLDTAADANRQGMRLAYGLAENETDYDSFWRGAMVLPELTREYLIPFADACRDRNLKLHLFGGHNFGSWEKEKAFLEWMAQALRDADHAETVALFEWRNEYPLTSPYGSESDETYRHGAEALELFKTTLGCICTMGSPGEDDDAIARSVQSSFADVAGLDIGRGYDGAQTMKHWHRCYYDGRFHGKYHGRALWVTEPPGPNTGGGDMYLPLEDPAYLFGMHAIFAGTGMATTYFNGPGVRHRYPIPIGWGFSELPALFEFIPEDVGVWKGPTWFTKDNQFVVVAAEEWGTLNRPDYPIKQWTALFYDGSTLSGEGPITIPSGWKATVVKGTW